MKQGKYLYQQQKRGDGSRREDLQRRRELNAGTAISCVVLRLAYNLAIIQLLLLVQL